MEKIKLIKIEKNKKRIEVLFTVTNGLKKYFKNSFYSEYDIDISSVPNSIAIIPFVCNVLPIIWRTNSCLEIKELDSTFYNSIEGFKEGYIRMYPQLSFKGEISVQQLIENQYNVTSKNVVLFSGGIDAICTYLRHSDENIELLTLWGSQDFPTNDEKGWNIQYNNILFHAKQFNVDSHYIKSNFSEFIPLWGKELQDLLSPVSGSWWHEMQHGIGIIGHAATYAYVHKIGKVYIASSYDPSIKNYTCASDPTIDNFVRFGSTQVIHDGYEWNRQDKIHFIINKSITYNYKLNIHVCLRQFQIQNCCHCEKCYRTILGILAEGANPNDYGFKFQEADIIHIIKELQYKIFLSKNIVTTYKHIQRRVLENRDNIVYKPIIEWFSEVDFDKINNTIPKQITKLYRMLRHLIGISLQTIHIKK